jgi:hypothetical protein
MLSAVEISNRYRKRCTPGNSSYQSSCGCRAARHGASTAPCASGPRDLMTFALTTPAPAPSRARNDRRAIEDCNAFPFMRASTFAMPSCANGIRVRRLRAAILVYKWSQSTSSNLDQLPSNGILRNLENHKLHGLRLAADSRLPVKIRYVNLLLNRFLSRPLSYR